MSLLIARCGAGDLDDWAALRARLWPEPVEDHRAEAATMIAADGLFNAIARDAEGRAVGFVEAALRHDYVNGCDHSPVAFVEGLYVRRAARRRGVARALVAAVTDWAEAQGVRELASDALLANRISRAMHLRLGFAETERVVYFRKPLA